MSISSASNYRLIDYRADARVHVRIENAEGHCERARQNGAIILTWRRRSPTATSMSASASFSSSSRSRPRPGAHIDEATYEPTFVDLSIGRKLESATKTRWAKDATERIAHGDSSSRSSAVAAATYIAGPPTFASSIRSSVIVVGAGAFGGWSALQLAQRGANVTLIDAWGPGNSRASSGGETRTIRATYGPAHLLYTRMVARALQLWREYERRWTLKLFFRSGALRMAGADDSYETAALPALKDAGHSV